MAPECCQIHAVDFVIKPSYTVAADIWALGCLFSDILVWTGLGIEGLEEYQSLRVEENSHRLLVDSAGFGSSFHNGTGPLNAVTRMHAKALEEFPADDPSHIASRIILERMLQESESRRDSVRDLRQRWYDEYERTGKDQLGSERNDKAIETIRRMVAAPPHSGLARAVDLPDPRHAFSDATPSEAPLTIGEVVQHIKSNGNSLTKGAFPSIELAVGVLRGPLNSGRSQVSHLLCSLTQPPGVF